MLNPDSHPEISHYHYKCTIAKEYQLNKERILSKSKHQSLHIIVDTNPILQFLGTKLTLNINLNDWKTLPFGHIRAHEGCASELE